MTIEREITEPVDLCTARGRLHPQAVGWSRQPQHTANLRGWGRTKRWEYWGIVTPDTIIGLTISSLDYAGVHAIYVLDRATGTETVRDAVEPLARSVRLAGRCGQGAAHARASGLELDFMEEDAGTRIRASAPGVLVAALVGPDAGECLGVVVPWNAKRFQYTCKVVARPVQGEVTIAGVRREFAADSFAVLDHGRGRWPYSVTWNWGAGFGVVAGQRVGLQVGGKWTDGTGSTENALIVDGRTHKISQDLAWEYEPGDWRKPWRISGDRLDATLTPFHERAARTNLGVIASEVHQCFGDFSGWALTEQGERVSLAGLVGWVEEARNRW